jgi:carbamoyltransferase
MFNLGLFGSHNSAVAISKNDKVLEVVEVERLVSQKNRGFWWYHHVDIPYNTFAVYEIRDYFKEKYGVVEYENAVFNSVPGSPYSEIFPAKNYIRMGHHMAHAYSGFYQSSYEDALIISADGGSDEGFFNVFIANRKEGIRKIYSGKKDLAVPYGLIGHYIEDIKREDIYIGNLVYAGKLMGLASYGIPTKDYIDKLYKIYNSENGEDIRKTQTTIHDVLGIMENYRFSGQEAKNLAASNQFVFEKIFEEESIPFLNEYPNLPVILVGGCGLNIVNNTRISKTKEVFVPPNPNDCGLAVGLVASLIKPDKPIDCTYIGPEVWDRRELIRIANERTAVSLDIPKIVDYIISGKIVGVVRGRCEHGPRALGNRSILCNPVIPNMKDILNLRVKGREYYRPFAPVVRLEDVNKYFEWDKESRWMSFCPNVRDEYKEKLGAVVHVDGTARVQTVTKEQNEFLYEVLSEMHNKTGIGILLNTSFNIAGKPILNTYKEALWVLDNKDMDAVLLENFFIIKQEN